MSSYRKYKRKKWGLLDRKFILILGSYMTGFFASIFIYIGGVSVFYRRYDPDYSFYMMVLIMLVVESPIAITHIIWLYRNKVVKMKPKTRNDLEDIAEYLQAQENFKNGNYEYETIRKKEDIKIAHQEGKKFVFQEKSGDEKGEIRWGIFLAVVGLILSIILIISNILNSKFNTFLMNLFIFIISNGMLGGIGFIYAFPNYLKLKHKSFIVMGPNGILKRSIWGSLRAYSWKDVKLKGHILSSTFKLMFPKLPQLPPAKEIQLILPRGGILKIHPEKYDLKEYFSLEKITDRLKLKIRGTGRRELRALETYKVKNYYFQLFALTFHYFFELGKYGNNDIKLET